MRVFCVVLVSSLFALAPAVPTFALTDTILVPSVPSTPFSQTPLPLPAPMEQAIVLGGVVTPTSTVVFVRMAQAGNLSDVFLFSSVGTFVVPSTGAVTSGSLLAFATPSDTLPFLIDPTIALYIGIPVATETHFPGENTVGISWGPSLNPFSAAPTPPSSLAPSVPLSPPTLPPVPVPVVPAPDTQRFSSLRGLRFASLLPDPIGSDTEGERIMLENAGTTEIDLSGVSLADAQTTYRFPAGSLLLAGVTIDLPRSQTKITLNNTGKETVTLTGPDGFVLDRVTYADARAGKRFERTPDGWFWEGEHLVTTPPTQPSAPTPVAAENLPPEAVISCPTSVTVGSIISCTADASTDPEGALLTYAWTVDGASSGTGKRLSVLARSEGDRYIDLTVRDPFGTSDTASWSITVAPNAPPATTKPSTPVQIPATPSVPSPSERLALARDVQLSEVFPAPVEDATDEWIELHNTGTRSYVLSGYQLDDLANGGSKPFVFPPDMTIAPDAYLVLHRSQTKLQLNNDTDVVRFLDPDGTELDTFTYTSTQSGKSYARMDEAWQLADPTPGAAPVIPSAEIGADKPLEQAPLLTPIPAPPSSQPTPASAVAPVITAPPTSPSVPGALSIAQVKATAAGTTITVQGIATTIPGRLLTDGFLLQDPTGAIQVLGASLEGLPSIELGSRVHVTGLFRIYQSGPAIRFASASAVRVLGNDTPLSPLEIPLSTITDQHAGILVRVAGTVTDRAANAATIEAGGVSLRVLVRPRTGIRLPLWKTGDSVKIVGILLPSSDGWRLYPRQLDDLNTASASASETKTSSPSDPSTPEDVLLRTPKGSLKAAAAPLAISAQRSTWKPLDIAAIAVVGLGLFATGFWFVWKSHGARIRSWWRQRFARIASTRTLK